MLFLHALKPLLFTHWQVFLLSLTLNTMVLAGWTAFPSVSCYKPEQNLSANLLYSQTQSSFVAEVQQVLLNLTESSFLCFCVNYSPAFSFVIQKPEHICFVCIVSTHQLNIAFHVCSVWKKIKYSIQLQIKLILCVCSDFYGPVILEKSHACKSWYVGRHVHVHVLLPETFVFFVSHCCHSESGFN